MSREFGANLEVLWWKNGRKKKKGAWRGLNKRRGELLACEATRFSAAGGGNGKGRCCFQKKRVSLLC